MAEKKKKSAKAKASDAVDKPDVEGEPVKTTGKKKKKFDLADKIIKDFYNLYSERPKRKVPKLDFVQKQKIKYVRDYTYNNVW